MIPVDVLTKKVGDLLLVGVLGEMHRGHGVLADFGAEGRPEKHPLGDSHPTPPTALGIG